MSIDPVFSVIFEDGNYVIISNNTIYVGDIYSYGGYNTMSEVVHNNIKYYKNSSYHNGIKNFVDYYHKYTQECVL